MFVPHNNCFELLGFDIMIDSYQKPWLLEVNISPSLTPDASDDFVIKNRLIVDILNTAGIVDASVFPQKKRPVESKTEDEGRETPTIRL